MNSLQKFAPAAVAAQSEFQKFLLRYGNPHTRKAYTNDWKKFTRECLEWFSVDLTKLEPAALSEELLVAWLRRSENQDHHLAAKPKFKRIESRQRLLACLSAFCSFLLRKRLISTNPVHLLVQPTKRANSYQKTECLTEAEIEKVLGFASENAKKARLQASGGGLTPAERAVLSRKSASADLLEVVAYTLLTVGMRVSELTSLRICDFVKDGHGHRLVMTLKGGALHDPYIHPVTAEKIRNYKERYRCVQSQTAPLFIRVQKSATAKPLTQYGIYRMIQRLVQSSGVPKLISPHGLRASLATALIRQNIPITHVKDLLGHQNIQTTNIYVKRANQLEESATLLLDTKRLFMYEPQPSLGGASAGLSVAQGAKNDQAQTQNADKGLGEEKI